MTARTTIAEGLGYLEGARWYDGALWFSDIRNRTVHRLAPSGELEVVARVEGRPSGLGFEPDGSLLVVSMEDAKLLRLRGGRPEGMEEVADLGPVAPRPNDMAVDREGRAYVSQFGYDLFGGEAPRPSGLVVRHADGRLETCGQGLVFPNGVVLSGDGRTLVTAESFASPRTRLTAFDVRDDGTLESQRVLAELGSPEREVVDGLCMDVEGGVWVALPLAGEFRRVAADGRVTETIAFPPQTQGSFCVDSVLGGPDMRTLYMLVADTTVERLADGWDSVARIEAQEVEVPGVRLD